MLGLVEREGGLDLSVVKNVQTQTIQPIMEGAIAANTTIYTDGYEIYNFLDRSPNYTRAQVCHSAGEYALDLDHDGIYETHVNTQEGVWSLLRPWIRPFRGGNKQYLPLYVPPCQFFYKRRQQSPAQSIRNMIALAVSCIGHTVKELWKGNRLLPLCSV